MMGLMDQVKSAVGTAAKDETVKTQVKSTVTDAASGMLSGKVDRQVISGTVSTVVDEAAKLAGNSGSSQS